MKKSVHLLLFFTLLSLNFFILQAFDAAAQRQVPQSQGQIVLSYAPLVAQSAPAVVNIYTSAKVKVRGGGLSPFFNDPFFSKFFDSGVLGRGLGRIQEKEISTLGSGVIVSSDGLVITNNHVVKEGGEIKVVLNNKQEFDAKLVISDEKSDLALLKIEVDRKLPYLHIAQHDNLQVGDIVLAIGNPFGVGQTVTGGIVSALARTAVGIGDYDFFIQTDAAINPGNSGGALVNMQGELVGINTAIYSKTGTSAGIGFATPSIMAKIILDNYRRGNSKVIRPWFGASTQNVTAELAESLGLDKPVGVLIKEIFPKSSAEDAGIKTGDVIVSINDKEVSDEDFLRFYMATYSIGQKAKLNIMRSGQYRTVDILMEEAKEYPLRNTTEIKGNNPMEGAIVENLSPVLADEIGISISKGVIIRDVPLGSYAARIFKSGDILESVNGINIKEVNQLVKLLNQPKKGWKIKARRGAQTISISIAL